MKQYVAEAIGTFALVFAGTGAVVIDELSGGKVPFCNERARPYYSDEQGAQIARSMRFVWPS